MNRLQAEMKTIPEFVDEELSTSLKKPSDVTFENSRRIIRVLCELYGENSHVASKFCVTLDGKFQIVLSENGNKGLATIDEVGLRLHNGYARTNKYVSLSYSDDQIVAQFKKYMKHYI
jgi:hypothetical protein